MRKLIVIFSLSFTGFLQAQNYFSIAPPNDTAQFSNAIQRTAHLLTDKTVESPEVRILVYGQSISAQKWWEQVKKYLDVRYPSVKVVMINKSIGGFGTVRLKHTVYNDIISFYPDLILYHNYGNEKDYEEIIKTMLSCTTTEIIVQNDHITTDQDEVWHDRHSNIWLPELCKKYGLAFADIRTHWKKYLKVNKLDAQQLLSDAEHLNDHGNYLMAGIIIKYFEALRIFPEQGDSKTKVLNAGTDFSNEGKTIDIEVYGNRFDIVTDSNSGAGASIKIDSKLPSQFSSAYYYTRPALVEENKFFLTNLGLPVQILPGKNIREEEWSLIIQNVDSISKTIHFSVSGSKTGNDGAGTSAREFISQSGRICIKPDGWFFPYDENDFSQFSYVKRGDRIHWRIQTMYRDSISDVKGRQTIIQGIPNGKHRLQLNGQSLRSIKKIIIYRPSLKVSPKKKYQ